MLGAGLVAGVLNLPAVLPEGGAEPVVVVAPASAVPAPDPTTPQPTGSWSEEEMIEAFFRAGYHYDDAVRLADRWQSAASIAGVKAEAGRRVLAGEALPSPAAADPRRSADSADLEDEWALRVYADRGYDYQDAMTLARLWQTDTDQAKVLAGRRLLAGETVPVRP